MHRSSNKMQFCGGIIKVHWLSELVLTVWPGDLLVISAERWTLMHSSMTDVSTVLVCDTLWYQSTRYTTRSQLSYYRFPDLLFRIPRPWAVPSVQQPNYYSQSTSSSSLCHLDSFVWKSQGLILTLCKQQSLLRLSPGISWQPCSFLQPVPLSQSCYSSCKLSRWVDTWNVHVFVCFDLCSPSCRTFKLTSPLVIAWRVVLHKY